MTASRIPASKFFQLHGLKLPHFALQKGNEDKARYQLYGFLIVRTNQSGLLQVGHHNLISGKRFYFKNVQITPKMVSSINWDGWLKIAALKRNSRFLKSETSKITMDLESWYENLLLQM